jgi:hypothetical protein
VGKYLSGKIMWWFLPLFFIKNEILINIWGVGDGIYVERHIYRESISRKQK